MTPLELVLQKLEAKGHPAKQRGSSWQARCPSHEDNSPSLSISLGDNGNALLYCHAGCATSDIASRLDLTISDLFAGTLDTKHIDGHQYKSEYRYYNENAELSYRVVKYVDKQGHKTYRQQAWDGEHFQPTLGNRPRVLYNLPRILKGIADGRPIWIVEGEKDVENLTWQCQAYATCNPGGADNGSGNKFTQTMIDQLARARIINICIDNDPPGILHGQYLANNLKAPCRVYHSTTNKDISDHLNAGHQLTDLEQLYDSQTPNEWAKPLATIEVPVIDNGWRLQAVTQWLTSDREETLPTIGQRQDGQGLFYTGKINSLFGESGCGKTWLLLETMAQEIRQGNNVAYLDFEDRGTTFVDRLRCLGLTDQQIEQHAQYAHPMCGSLPEEIDLLADQLIVGQITVVGIDSAGEGLAVADLNPNADEEVAAWYREIPRRLAETGSCVILIDHLPKNTEHSKLSAIGSQRKKAAIDGASHLVKLKKPFSKDHPDPGVIETLCAKDRHGTYPTGAQSAEINLTPMNGLLMIAILDPKDPLPTHEWTPEQLDASIDWIARQPDRLHSGKILAINKDSIYRPMSREQAQGISNHLQSDRYSEPAGKQWRLLKNVENLSGRIGQDDSCPIESIGQHRADIGQKITEAHAGFPLSGSIGQDDSCPIGTDIGHRAHPYGLKGCPIDEIPDYPDDPFSDEQLFDNPTGPRRFTQ